MEAPEKIHIQPNAHDGWFEGNIPNGLPNGLFVEYTRTDAFIEKACEWLFKYTRFTRNDILDFKKAMEK